MGTIAGGSTEQRLSFRAILNSSQLDVCAEYAIASSQFYENQGFGPEAMPNFPIRVIHLDEKTAYDVFHNFAPLQLAGNEGCSRKRDGNSQVIVLRGISEKAFRTFRAACLAHPTVVNVVEITEEDFWRAPSNAI